MSNFNRQNGRIGRARPRLAGAIADRFGLFARQEDGNLTVFSMVMLSLMIAFGGLAVDMMRYELTRATLQNTLDRAALASAALSQTLVPEDVVADYFDKAGIADQLIDVVATEGLNFRRVEAYAEADTRPMFLNMVGLTQLHVQADTAAEQRINNVEIVMVLDVSGSMGNNSRIENLQVAAKEFVDTLLTDDVEKKISIGMVPFNSNVNLGADLISAFNATHDHGVPDFNCVDVPDTAFSTLSISTSLGLPMTSLADTASGTSGSNWTTSNRSPAASMPACEDNLDTIVRLPGQDVGVLQTQIDALDANGYTSINVGMRWGLTLLDPAMQAAYTGFIADDKMPDELAGRPFDFTDDEAMKVIVLMTDGENTSSDVVYDQYKTGPSPIWKATDNYYSIFHSSKVTLTNATTICNSRPFWVPHLSVWHSRPWNGTAPVATACYEQTPTVAYTNTNVQNWETIWSVMRASYVANQFYKRALGGNLSTYTDMFAYATSPSTMDEQLQDVCDLAKDEGVIVFGISFEAPTNGATQIQQCSSSNAHYFEATGVQISTVFAAIANNISQLRLVQ